MTEKPIIVTGPRKGSLAALMGGVAIAAAYLGLLKAEEGYVHKPYRDIAGVWTACVGDTENIDPNHIYTDAECDARLERQATRHIKGVLRCTPNIAGAQLIAAGSLAYNIGEYAYCHSTAARLFNLGQTAKACDAFLPWNKAKVKGVLRVVKGLDDRRHKERNICLEKDTLGVQL